MASPAISHSICLIGESEIIQGLQLQIMEVAPTDASVLILGEAGVGKGTVARMIHGNSGRGPRDRMIEISCAAIHERLGESELFGHRAGAFVGADRAKPGLLQLAAGGTILLDGIGDLSPHMQAMLLAAIDQREFRPLGAQGPCPLSARFLASADLSLDEAIKDGRFREELFGRLTETSIFIPPLRERMEDVPLLVRHFLELYGKRLGRPGLRLPGGCLDKLMRHSWPGNVRELETVIRHFALKDNPNMIHGLLEA